MEEEPHLGAAAAILDEAGRLLLVKENYDRRRWSLPGGAVERGESPLDAVVREAAEETGLSVAVEHLVGIYRLDNGFTVSLFRCSVAAGEPGRPTSGEIEAVGWFALDALPSPVSNVLHHSARDIRGDARGVVRDELPRIN
jgi:8-oxo-dGTP diphosphatase